MKKDYNQIAKFEKAISDKYGEEAIQNPKKYWTKEKEKKYLKELEEFYKIKDNKKKKENKSGYILKQAENHLKQEDRICPVCGVLSFKMQDEIYMNKFQCCEDCYIKFVEDREERWFSGWRPNN